MMFATGEVCVCHYFLLYTVRTHIICLFSIFSRFPDTLANMTTPKQFYKNMKKVIKTLESFLPSKSHVVLLGLVNGSFIFETLANRIHPIGKVRSKN